MAPWGVVFDVGVGLLDVERETTGREFHQSMVRGLAEAQGDITFYPKTRRAN